jgi:DNA mismatch repair ATPase MutS
MVADIEFVEQQIKEQMGLFVGYFFEEFRKNQKVWEKFLAVLAEIDCLVSLSLFSYQSGGVRP